MLTAQHSTWESPLKVSTDAFPVYTKYEPKMRNDTPLLIRSIRLTNLGIFGGSQFLAVPSVHLFHDTAY